MIKSILKRRNGRGGGAVLPAADLGYDITTARLPGRSIIAFQKRGGQAAALEVTEQGAEILSGLAAGAVLSEIEEIEAESDEGATPMIADRGASREETEAFIQSLDLLDTAEKKALTKALPR